MPSPFSMEQQRWIIFRYGACPSVKTIRREFRQKFDVPPFDVPGELAFYRIIKRFNTTNSTVPKSKKEDGAGRPMTGRSPENIDTIRQSITQAGDQSIRVLSVQNDIPQTTVQRILRWCERLCLSVGPGDCQEGCQGHHLQSWLLLGQRRFSIWV